MRIGVISDTHVKTIDDIPAKILKALAEVDLIVHAGDFTDMTDDEFRAMVQELANYFNGQGFNESVFNLKYWKR